MSAYLGLILLLAVSLGLLWLMRLRGPLLTLAAAALMFGCAGYALQGRPDLAGEPRSTAANRPPLPLAGVRRTLMGQFDYADSWLNIADALASRGRTEEAARLLQAQVSRRPNDYKLWVGLGNALTDHARMLTPAGRLAFERAALMAPNHPGPPFFLGLAEARSGNPAEAERLWQEILATAPADASWRPVITDGLKLLGRQPARAQPTQTGS